MTMTDTSIARDALLEGLDGGTWRARSGTARAVGVAWYAVHIGLAFAVTAAVARALGRPDGWPLSICWFVALSCVASGVLEVTQRLGRRLIPLRALLRLSLAFPGVAPSRYALALRAGNPRFLARRLSDANEHGIGTEPDATAVALLELVAALSRHDRALRGHSERVRAYSELVAEEFGLDRGARDGLRWAGLMHDIGKLEIPAAVLNKAGPLTPREWNLIRRHPETGAELCAPLVPWLGEWAAAVLDHHERWDGDGYPRGLTETDISLAGRVVAVADAFDVMTSARSYKKPRPVDQALEELVRCSGTQFDPNVVHAFLGIPVRKLRRVMGPVTVWAQRPFGGWSLGRLVDTFGGPIVAICVAAIVGLLAPILGAPAHSQLPPLSPPAQQSSGGTSGGATFERTNLDASAPTEPGRLVVTQPTGNPPAVSIPADGVSPVAPPPAVPSDPASSTAPGDEVPPTEPASSGSSSVGITIDPAAGSVSVDGVGSASVPDVMLVQVPGAGVACSGAGICDPVTVTLPVPGP